MVRWLAPIMCFTAEEIWAELPGERAASVMLSEFYELPAVGELKVNWGDLLQVRTQVDKQLEAARNDGKIGSPLEAEVVVKVSGSVKSELESLGDELRFVFITSEARVEEGSGSLDGDIPVDVVASEHAKCTRCWHRRDDVGSVAGHEEVCGRCADNVDGAGEQRQFA